MTSIVDNDLDNPLMQTDGIFTELQSVEQPQEETPNVETQPSEPELPEKFRNKPVQDIVRSYEELEKQLGKQGQELGELRKLTDEFLKRSLSGDLDKDHLQTRQRNDDEELALLNGIPDEAVNKLLEKKIGPILEEVYNTKKERMTAKLNEKHPDFAEIVQNPEFVDWVKSSRIRGELFMQAHQGYDYNAADELFTVWKERKGVKPKAPVNTGPDEETVRNAVLETGTANDTAPKKLYRRADIMNLMMNDRARYDALQPEIIQAYREGRVR